MCFSCKFTKNLVKFGLSGFFSIQSWFWGHQKWINKVSVYFTLYIRVPCKSSAVDLRESQGNSFKSLRIELINIIQETLQAYILRTKKNTQSWSLYGNCSSHLANICHICASKVHNITNKFPVFLSAKELKILILSNQCKMSDYCSYHLKKQWGS